MSDEAKADALEHQLLAQTNPAPKFPTAAEIEAQIDTRPTAKCGQPVRGAPGKRHQAYAAAAATHAADYFNCASSPRRITV